MQCLIFQLIVTLCSLYTVLYAACNKFQQLRFWYVQVLRACTQVCLLSNKYKAAAKSQVGPPKTRQAIAAS